MDFGFSSLVTLPTEVGRVVVSFPSGRSVGLRVAGLGSEEVLGDWRQVEGSVGHTIPGFTDGDRWIVG